LILVGLTGKAGAGKDTVADRLVDKHGFKRMSFAGPLKGVLDQMNPIIGFDLYNTQSAIHLRDAMDKYGEEAVKKLYPEYRRLLQKLGTEGIRSLDNDFWIKAAAKMIKEEANDARLVFTDCRFPNEAKAIQEAGWVGNYILPLPSPTAELWQIHRDVERQGEVVEAHASEAHVGQMGEERLILNNGTIADLHWDADQLARDLIDVEGVKLAGG
jgi:hypothetical protein